MGDVESQALVSSITEALAHEDPAPSAVPSPRKTPAGCVPTPRGTRRLLAVVEDAADVEGARGTQRVPRALSRTGRRARAPGHRPRRPSRGRASPRVASDGVEEVAWPPTPTSRRGHGPLPGPEAEANGSPRHASLVSRGGRARIRRRGDPFAVSDGPKGDLATRIRAPRGLSVTLRLLALWLNSYSLTKSFSRSRT
jgi:hypothetical protein